jgi:MFS family permease
MLTRLVAFDLLQFNDQILQLFTSSLFLAGAFAALVGMITCKKYGRRFTMVMGGLCFIIGEAICLISHRAQCVTVVKLRSPRLGMHTARHAVLNIVPQLGTPAWSYQNWTSSACYQYTHLARGGAVLLHKAPLYLFD